MTTRVGLTCCCQRPARTIAAFVSISCQLGVRAPAALVVAWTSHNSQQTLSRTVLSRDKCKTVTWYPMQSQPVAVCSETFIPTPHCRHCRVLPPGKCTGV